MTHSLTAVNLVVNFESIRLAAYNDIVGVPTIGYGHTAGVRLGQTCTVIQARQWLNADLAAADDAITKHVTVELNQNQWDALADFIYNLGESKFASSTLLKLINNSQFTQAADALLEWDHAGGKVVAGLLRRRNAERTLFLTPEAS